MNFYLVVELRTKQNVLFETCHGLRNALEAIDNGKPYKILRSNNYFDQVQNWKSIKGISN